MMASRDAIIAFANDYLSLEEYPDYGPMGLQVAGGAEVERIACGVSASRELFEKAAGAGADLLIVHHGLFWDRDPRIVDPPMRRRLEILFAADMSLAAYHLALDAHPEVGNNALLCRALGINPDERFAAVGFGGGLESPCSVEELAGRLERELGRAPLVFPSGPDEIGRVAVCSGGAASYLAEAAARGYDCYVTGEPAEPSMAVAAERGIHFVAGGHYATETMGVQALTRRLAEQFGVDWSFLDVPNPV
jgi:dinuclear metal center YbgI/SA1388 family protein